MLTNLDQEIKTVILYITNITLQNVYFKFLLLLFS